MKRFPIFLFSLFFTYFCFSNSFFSIDARPGGGQSYRSSSPSRSYGGSSRSYGGSSRSYGGSSGSYTYGGSSRSYGGSSGSYTYGGSSGSSTYSGNYGPFSTIIPIFGGVFILGFILFICIRLFQSKNKQRERAQVYSDSQEQQEGVLALQERDPNFSIPAFLDRVKAIMAKVNEAWIQGNMGSARRLISDGVYVRFQTQLNLLRSQGIKNTMSDWRVISAEFLAADSDTQWDTIHVKVIGEARDLDVPIELSSQDAQQKAKKVPLTSYQEVWSFIRKRGKQSKNGVPALEGHCPNCGADLPLTDTIRCDHCQVLVNSGEHDFVLAEITQPEEWSPYSTTQIIPGLAELQQHDSKVSRQELEDRASVIFWKWIEAVCTGNTKKLARFSVVSLDQSEESEKSEKLKLTRRLLSQVAVGSCEVIHVSAQTSEELDRVWLEIRWSASVQGNDPQPFRHIFILVRSSHAQSKGGLSSLDCPVCGGPLAESDATTCAYCGETLSGAKHEWALEEVELT